MEPFKLLAVENLKVFFKSIMGIYRAVDGVSFNVDEKTIYGIAGESGCGKSTLVEGILRLVEPPGYIADGKVFFEGKNLLELSDNELRQIRWKRLSYVPQASMNALNPIMKVEAQIVDSIVSHENVSESKAKERATKLLKAVGLPKETAEMFPHELSGGMKQRAIIAMAVALSPKLVIADEPTTALDVTMQRAVIESLKDLRKKFGVSVIVVAHDLAVHAEIADRMMIMYAGKTVEIGDVKDVFKRPSHPYTQALISSVHELGRKRTIKGIPGLSPSPLDWPSGCRFHPRCQASKDRCKMEQPELIEIEKGRLVACHFYG